jgi:hypothetical protein
VEVESRGKENRIMVAGTSNKNKLGMQKKVAKLAERLASLTSGK